MVYRYEGAEVHTDEVATITVERGCGPRYGEFAPNGKAFYLINEIGSRVMHYRYNAGKMTLCEETSTLPYGFTGENICSDLHITADGKFLYASNRGHDSITAYHIMEDGSLAWIECSPAAAKRPATLRWIAQAATCWLRTRTATTSQCLPSARMAA